MQSKTIYSIVGKSTKLTQSHWESMLYMRKKVRGLACDYSDIIMLNGEVKEPKIALTFDDGPDSIITAKIIDILNSYGVKGNFFFIGENVKKHPEVVLRAYQSGHLVGNHTWSHASLVELSYEEIGKEIEETDKLLTEITKVRNFPIRPPFGYINKTLIKFARDAKRKLFLWSIDTLDWSGISPHEINENIINNLRHGDIILMHSDCERNKTVEALPYLIETILSQGYSMTTLDKIS